MGSQAQYLRPQSVSEGSSLGTSLEIWFTHCNPHLTVVLSQLPLVPGAQALTFLGLFLIAMERRIVDHSSISGHSRWFPRQNHTS